tara:strand:- start:3764 stop:4201 length:438 start_codon:yes stop_codon:yes gene_type:complete
MPLSLIPIYEAEYIENLSLLGQPFPYRSVILTLNGYFDLATPGDITVTGLGFAGKNPNIVFTSGGTNATDDNGRSVLIYQLEFDTVGFDEDYTVAANSGIYLGIFEKVPISTTKIKGENTAIAAPGYGLTIKQQNTIKIRGGNER